MGKALATLIRYATRDEKMIDKHRRVCIELQAPLISADVACTDVCRPGRLFGHEPLPHLAQLFHPSSELEPCSIFVKQCSLNLTVAPLGSL
jgi:hypothetical protein